jgi:ABC-type transport system involved in cytochrome c biogenesis ATPase subunit
MTTLTPDPAPPAAETGVALEVAGLTAGYGGPPIIEDVSVRAHRGAITAIVGPNGAGKSTLLKAIAGVIRPTAGTVLVEGKEVTGLASEKLVRRGIAYVPQVANVWPQLSIHENLEMGGYSRRHGVQERAEELYQLFPDLKLAHRRHAETLSGGQRTMLAMARGQCSSSTSPPRGCRPSSRAPSGSASSRCVPPTWRWSLSSRTPARRCVTRPGRTCWSSVRTVSTGPVAIFSTTTRW